MDNKFDSLLIIARALEEAGIFYVLSSGTLLGAVRGGAMVMNDYDFDLDAKSEDEEKILGLNPDLEAFNITLEKYFGNVVNVWSGEIVPDLMADHRLIRVKRDGIDIGDIFLFTCFNDGILRRFDTDTNLYQNPRHQTPAWFWQERVRCKLYGEEFWAPQYPEVLLESMYGETWTKPIAAGEHGRGRHESGGAVVNRKMQEMILFALKRGWDEDYSECPKWPAVVSYVNSKRAINFLCWSEPEALISNKENILGTRSESTESSSPMTPFQYRKMADIAGMRGAQYSSACNKAVLKLPGAKQLKELTTQIEQLKELTTQIETIKLEKEKLVKDKKAADARWEQAKNEPFRFWIKAILKKV